MGRTLKGISMVDRRATNRFDSRVVVNWGLSRGAIFTEDFARNISKNGLCLVTLRPPKQNDKIDLEILSPGQNAQFARGLVKWVRPIAKQNKTEFDVGIEFVEFAKGENDFCREKKFYDFVTRVWQSLVCVTALVFISPLFLIMAVISRTVNGGHIIYRGLRVGKDKKLFTIYKFRTLKKNAESEIGDRLFNHQTDVEYYLPLGLFLRRTKLDEIPQLYNVIKGDMNLVGPRPIRPVFLNKYICSIPNYEMRFAIKPGITGSAQLRGHYYTSDRNKLRYDLIYMKNRSVLLDLKIIFLTFVKVLRAWTNLARKFFAKPSLEQTSDDPCIGPVKNTEVVEALDKCESS